jgi:hypothetical protein
MATPTRALDAETLANGLLGLIKSAGARAQG